MVKRLKVPLFFAQFFLIIFTFSITRALRGALVTTNLGAQSLPWIWICTAVIMLAWTSVYSRWITKYKKIHVISGNFVFFGLALACIWFCSMSFPRFTTVATYVWADLFPVVFVELFWSIADDGFKLNDAKKFFGLINAGGSLGGASSGIAASFMASHFGSLSIFPVSLIAIGISLILTNFVFHSAPSLEIHVNEELDLKDARTDNFYEDVKVILKNSYLLRVLLNVFLSQVLSNLIEYQFSSSIERGFTTLDDRTTYIGKFLASVSGISMVISLIAPIIMKWIGQRGAFIVTPIMCFFLNLLEIITRKPLFVPLMKGSEKIFSYSLDRITKEFLYLPVPSDLKFKSKAIIDILVYRFAKIGASAVILPLSFLPLMTITGFSIFTTSSLVLYVRVQILNNLTRAMKTEASR